MAAIRLLPARRRRAGLDDHARHNRAGIGSHDDVVSGPVPLAMRRISVPQPPMHEGDLRMQSSVVSSSQVLARVFASVDLRKRQPHTGRWSTSRQHQANALLRVARCGGSAMVLDHL